MKTRTPLILLLVLLIGGVLRFYGLAASPGGLWYDEALNGENTQRILAGERPIFFYPDGYPQEPLYFYLQAGVAALTTDGRPAIWPLRATSALIGLFTLLIFYGFARQVLPRGWALLAIFILAIFPWHIHFSRLGFRTILAPLFVSVVGWALAVWLGAPPQPKKLSLPAIATGLLLGLSLYSYTAVNALPVSVMGSILVLYFVKGKESRPVDNLSLVWFIAAFILIFSPLLYYYISSGGQVLDRAKQVAPGSGEFSWYQNVFGLILFYGGLSGDAVFKHGPPYRPMFELFFVAFFWLGVWGLLMNWKRRFGIGVYLLLTLFGFITVSLLSDHAPNKLRMTGAIPIVVLCFTEGLRRFALTLRVLNVNKSVACFAIAVILAHWSWANASAYWYGWHRNAAIYNEFSGPFTQTGLWAQGAPVNIPTSASEQNYTIFGTNGLPRDFKLPAYIPSAIANHATVRYLTSKTLNVSALNSLEEAVLQKRGGTSQSYLLLTRNAPNNATILDRLQVRATPVASLANPINGSPWGTWLLIQRRAAPFTEEERAVVAQYLTDR